MKAIVKVMTSMAKRENQPILMAWLGFLRPHSLLFPRWWFIDLSFLIYVRCCSNLPRCCCWCYCSIHSHLFVVITFGRLVSVQEHSFWFHDCWFVRCCCCSLTVVLFFDFCVHSSYHRTFLPPLFICYGHVVPRRPIDFVDSCVRYIPHRPTLHITLLLSIPIPVPGPQSLLDSTVTFVLRYHYVDRWSLRSFGPTFTFTFPRLHTFVVTICSGRCSQ